LWVAESLATHKQLLSHPSLREQFAALRAEELALSGKSGAAIEILEPLITGHERYQTRRVLADAYAAAGQTKQALVQVRWLKENRGLAYIEQGCGQCLQPLNVVDSNLAMLREAELLREMGDAKAARRAMESFDRQWPVETLPAYFKVRLESLKPASN
jgi:hypothetical protein